MWSSMRKRVEESGRLGKDRPAARMNRRRRAVGRADARQDHLDATSGNTGIAYDMIGPRARIGCGFACRRTSRAGAKADPARVRRRHRFTDPMQGSDGAILRAREMYAADQNVYFYADQYNNPDGAPHYDTTAPENHRADERTSDPFRRRAGTSGTFVGAGRRLREFNAAIRLISVQPDSPLHGLEA